MENNNKDNNKINKYNKKGYKIIVGTMVIALVGSGLMWNRNQAYAITIDNEVVAITKDRESVTLAYSEVVDNIKQEVNADIAVNEELGIRPVKAKGKDLSSYEQLTKVINSNISYGVEAYEIIVNGKPQVVIEKANDAEIVLQEIANEYLPKQGELTLQVEDLNTNEENTNEEEVNIEEANIEEVSLEQEADVQAMSENVVYASDIQQSPSNQLDSEVETRVNKDKSEVIEVEQALPQAEVVSQIKVGEINVEATIESSEEENSQKIKRQINDLQFNEDVVVKSVYVPMEEIVCVNEAKEALTGMEIISLDYILEAGDNIWDIAMSHGTTMDRIMEINPQIQDETMMQIGDVIKVEVPKPILSISTVEQAIFKEVIPGEVESVEFSDLYEDETKVYQEGYDGVKELTVEVTKLNGVEVARKTISEKVLKEAKTQVIAYGTKKRPVVVEPTINAGNNTGTSTGTVTGNTSNNNNIGNSQFIHPLKGAGRVSSEYGPRWGTFHHGIDFAAPSGTPIYASAAGKVTYSGYNNGGYGYLVIIDHGNGYQTYYAHNSSLYVSVGAQVSQGQHIAGVGTTGDSTGNHLHFEVRKNGTPINPRNVLK